MDPSHRPEATLEELIEASASADESAFRAVYDRTHRHVFGMLLRILAQRELAEELLVDVYTQAWRQAGRFDRERASVLRWLATIARSRAVDRLRANGRDADLVRESDELGNYTAPGRSPLEDCQWTERSRCIAAALGRLSDDQRVSIELAFFWGLTHREIAERLRQPLGTVKTRIRNGLSSLRQCLEANREGAA